MQHTILLDFGSTYTKMCVFDLNNAEVVLTARHPSTVRTDAGIGLMANLDSAAEVIGRANVRKAQIVASSSAAGGLRMVVVGLTPRYSLLAGTNVALGAGARVIKSYSFRLNDADLLEIETIDPEILLLCGGVEDGNAEWLYENAEKLANGRNFRFPVVYAGNRTVAREIRTLFLQNKKECYVVENVFPQLDVLHAGPAGEVIRNLFMKRITGMKGLNQVKAMIGEIIMPTPAAVLAGGTLVAEGADGAEGFGKSLVFDIGGATTDVYSFLKNTAGDAKQVGSPEPEYKRTVEGDLGLRSSALSLLETADVKKLAAQLGADEKRILEECRYRTEHEDFVAADDWGRQFDYELAKLAVFFSARRHGGHIENAYAKGAKEIQVGKNLTKVDTVIGTGGPIINGIDPKGVMQQALRCEDEKEILLPQKVRFYLDKKYLLYAVGLCASIDPAGAFEIARRNIEEI